MKRSILAAFLCLWGLGGCTGASVPADTIASSDVQPADAPQGVPDGAVKPGDAVWIDVADSADSGADAPDTVLPVADAVTDIDGVLAGDLDAPMDGGVSDGGAADVAVLGDGDGAAADVGEETDVLPYPTKGPVMTSPPLEPVRGGYYGCEEDVSIPTGADVPGPCVTVRYGWIYDEGLPTESPGAPYGVSATTYGYDCQGRQVHLEYRLIVDNEFMGVNGIVDDTLDDKGRVTKTVRQFVTGYYHVTTTEYDDAGDVTKVLVSSGDPPTHFESDEYVYQRNSLGQIVRRDYYKAEWDLGETPKPTWYHQTYEYDETGRLSAKDLYQHDGLHPPDGWFLRKTFAYIPTPLGEMTREMEDWGVAHWAYSDDCWWLWGMCYTLEQGPEGTLPADGALEGGQEYIYDEKGYLVLYRFFVDWGNGEDSGVTCPYDEPCFRIGESLRFLTRDPKGLPAVELGYASDWSYEKGTIPLVKVYAFDEFGREIQRSEWWPGHGWMWTERHFYDCWDLGTARNATWDPVGQ